MTRRFYTPGSFTVLVGTPGRTAFTNQIIMDDSGNHRIAHLQGDPGPADLQITISDANFTNTLQAGGTITVGIPLAGDTVTIGGIVLLGVAGARVPGNNDFNIGAGVVSDEIAAAINDGANFFAPFVTAVSASPVVTLTGVPIGELGNSVTLVSSTAQLVVSGAVLTGGSTGGQSSISLGEHTLTTNIDWIPVNGNANASATALAAAIDALEGFTASAIAADITIVGPTGPSELSVSVLYQGSGGNYTFTPDTDTISGTPIIGPPIIS